MKDVIIGVGPHESPGGTHIVLISRRSTATWITAIRYPVLGGTYELMEQQEFTLYIDAIESFGERIQALHKQFTS